MSYTIIVPANTNLRKITYSNSDFLRLPGDGVTSTGAHFYREDNSEVTVTVGDVYSHTEIYDYDIDETTTLHDELGIEYGPVVGAHPHIIRK